ncbi:MAG: hypothetical protein ACREFV_00265 [Acetobacteraceae bacterium]
MPPIGGYQAAESESVRLGVRSIGESVMTVPAPETARDFYCAFGLEVAEGGKQVSPVCRI